MPISTFRVYSLDVWGNARDGYDVNEQHYTGTDVTFRYKDTLSDVRQPRIPAKGDAPAYGWGKPVLVLQNTDSDA